MSYAINRAFDHVKAAFDCDANPSQLFERMITQDRWARWCALQDGVTKQETLEGFLIEQGMAPWARLIRSLEIGDRPFTKYRS